MTLSSKGVVKAGRLGGLEQGLLLGPGAAIQMGAVLTVWGLGLCFEIDAVMCVMRHTFGCECQEMRGIDGRAVVTPPIWLPAGERVGQKDALEFLSVFEAESHHRLERGMGLGLGMGGAQ